MKLNELICPSCGLKCLTDAAYTTCDGCSTFFYASQSRSRDNPAPMTPSPWLTNPYPFTSPYTVLPQPQIEIKPIWIAPYGPPGTPYGPTVTYDIGGTVSSTSEGLQVWN